MGLERLVCGVGVGWTPAPADASTSAFPDGSADPGVLVLDSPAASLAAFNGVVDAPLRALVGPVSRVIGTVSAVESVDSPLSSLLSPDEGAPSCKPESQSPLDVGSSV